MSSLPNEILYGSPEYLHQHTHLKRKEESSSSNVFSKKNEKEKENATVQRLVSYVSTFKPPTKQPFIIGVCGGSASGKTTVCREIVKSLSDKRVAVISQDSFYRNLTDEERELAKNNVYDFDHPDAFDYDAFEESTRELKAGNPVDIPVYDFKTHSRTSQTERVEGADVIIIEGILIFFTKEMRELMDMKIFVDTDADVRLARRIRRDTKERGRDLEGILLQYERFVKPSFDDYIMPTKKYADIIIPRGGANTVAIDLLVQHIHLKLLMLEHHKE
ncbi:hypothetical protein FDP41_006484 [Naegleria fowleri]|uniref:Uridine kinase n=1 Tax=Naegleria fowleri TaxID=5763 RepID=A0A6A5BHZ9_NAEFO|nr:uncharacterized protein FDP41_006484 [Naegleria fowleri]KAF0974452.1 hypothetical protein FDP41_006484 [Naegleria fowleri]CAG4708881.1 unnamed protein product [Naegleria fowleri]